MTIDFADPPAKWSALGYDYRVIVHVTIWQAEDVLTMPVGALFRQGDDWTVFALKDGRARATIIRIGQRNNRQRKFCRALPQAIAWCCTRATG
ncbi:hypothetical protein [Mesorhizobium sp. M00.F.Ca.ET.216.01.1.1]|uniref:hypothetical protein n=1 Tax=Mesorhizobium sp. M00.F.Ca.ET.216.01.1.1 TaxID=2500528 RepID=UPI001675638B